MPQKINPMLDIVKEEVKSLIDPEALLSHLGANIHFRSRNELRCSCPIHHGRKPNFGWSNGVWSCFSRHCGEDIGVPRDAFLLVQLVRKCSFPDALKELAEMVGLSIDENMEFDKDKYDGYQVKKWLKHRQRLNNTQANPIDEDLLDEFRGLSHPYLQSRGFSSAAIEEFEIGYTSDSQFEREGIQDTSNFPGRIIVPVRNHENQLVGFSGRIATDDKTIIEKYNKYRNQVDFTKGSILYGLNKAKDYISCSELPLPKSLVLVEGFFDVIRAWDYGACNVVAVMGSSLIPAQIELVVGHTSTVVLAFDSDTAGQKATERIYNQLKTFCSVYVLELPKKDIGELSFDEFWEAYTNPVRPKKFGKVG